MALTGEGAVTSYNGIWVLWVLLAGCTVAPVQEMSNARQAIAAAEHALASRSADNQSLIAARAALADAESSLHHHAFHQARDQAIKAHQLALQAQDTSTTESSPP